MTHTKTERTQELSSLEKLCDFPKALTPRESRSIEKSFVSLDFNRRLALAVLGNDRKSLTELWTNTPENAELLKSALINLKDGLQHQLELADKALLRLEVAQAFPKSFPEQGGRF